MMDLKTYGYTKIEVMLPNTFRTSMFRIKRATSSTRGIETKHSPCVVSKRRKVEGVRNEY